ncbi:MAG: acyl-CoA thioesterase [Nitrospinota bacterium]
MEIDIYHEDTDCAGVVYYANYLRYFERARTKLLTDKNISLTDYQKKGVVFAVVNATVNYIQPAVYGDRLVIETKVDDVKNSSFTVHYVVSRKSDDRLIATGSTRMACISSDKKKPIRIPPDIHSALR